MKNLQPYLNQLLEKYAVGAKAELTRQNTAVLADGETIPLLPLRGQRRFAEFAGLMREGAVRGVSTFRIGHAAARGSDLREIARMELDLCEFLLDTRIAEVFAVQNGGACNIVAATADGPVCTLELSAALPAGTPEIVKHEIIAEKGVVCDLVVDTQVPQSSIYVFADAGETAYTDVDFELYGLERDEVWVVRQAFELARDPALRRTLLEADARSRAVLRAVEQSAASGANVRVGAQL